jgi:hypothetical protein
MARPSRLSAIFRNACRGSLGEPHDRAAGRGILRPAALDFMHMLW